MIVDVVEMDEGASVKFHVLPILSKDSPTKGEIRLAEKFRDIRLTALKTNPNAFATTYETQVQLPLEHWLERLSNKKGVHHVAILETATNHNSIEPEISAGLLESKWVGMVFALGPQDGEARVSAKSDPFAQMTAPDDTGHVSSPSSSLHYHLNGVFVAPEVRGKGVGQNLLDAAIQQAEAEARKRGRPGVTFTILVDADNPPARRLYEKVGFEVTGQHTYTQQPRAGESTERQRVALSLELRKVVNPGEAC